jgi:hypothetical protein
MKAASPTAAEQSRAPLASPMPPQALTAPAVTSDATLPELDQRDLQIAVLATVLAFAAYLLTLSRGVLGGDAGELQFVPWILGLTHPTGYPLQVLLHFAWSIVPISSAAYRLNLLDAAIAATAIGVVTLLTRSIGATRPGALIAGLSLAFGELWWSQAVRGDKYTLNGLFLALVLLLFFRWRQQPTQSRLNVLAIVYGLSLTHHRGMLLVAPGLVIGLFLADWRPSMSRGVLVPILLVLAPLLLYAYVPWAGSRGLPPGSWPVATPGQFVEYLLDRGYTSQIRPDEAFRGRLWEEATVLRRSFGVFGSLLGLVGLCWAARRDWRATVVLLVALLSQAIIGASYVLESHYELPRHWVFFLPGFLIWSVWEGYALGDLVAVPPTRGRVFRLSCYGLVLLALTSQIVFAWMPAATMFVRAEAGAETLDAWRQDLQRSPLADRFGRLALESAAPGSFIVCDWEQATVLWYLQRVEGIRPDVTIRYPIETLNETVARTALDGRTVYIARTLPDVDVLGVTSSVGPLVQIRPAPDSSLPSSATPLDARFQGSLALMGVSHGATSLEQGSVLPVTLFWRVDAPVDADYAVSVRLVNAIGQIVARHDESSPALGTSRTHTWPAGVVVGDFYELPIGSRLPPGEYRVQVVPYSRDLPAGLPTVDAAGNLGAVGTTALMVNVASRQIRSPLDLVVRLLAR